MADIDKQNAMNTSEALTELGGSSTRHSHFQVDVRSSNQIEQLMADIKKNYQRYPCISVNCHGITRDDFLIKMSEEYFNEVINVNLKVYHHSSFLHIPMAKLTIMELGGKT